MKDRYASGYELVAYLETADHEPALGAYLVGDPHVVLLDEPSAGLDPVSQRNLWNLIKSTMTGRAVLLTTHSMLEADALCDRIGIQVRGQFHCVGSCVEINQCVGRTR